MRIRDFLFSVVLVVIVLVFFACSSDSNESSDSGETPAPNISSQIYDFVQCSNPENPAPSMEDCDINTLYKGSGVIKNIILGEYEEEPIDTVEAGTITNGKINLKLDIPEEKYLDESGAYGLFELYVFDNTDKVIGHLILKDSDFNLDDDVFAFYWYLSEDEKHDKEWDLLPDDNVKFKTHLDFKKGWNLYYYGNKYEDIDGVRMQTVTKTTNAAILKGKELRWYLVHPDMH